MTSEIQSISSGEGGKTPLSWGTIAGIGLLALYLCYQFGFVRGQAADNPGTVTFHSDSQTITQLKAENAALTQKQAEMAAELQSLQAQKEQLEVYLMEVKKNNAQMARDLALTFTPKETVTAKAFMHISDFKVYPTSHPQTYRYVFSVTRDIPSTQKIKGVVQMTLQGRVGNKMLFIPVKYDDNSESNGLQFECAASQNLSGELTLPAQFEPLKVVLQVHIPGGLIHQQQSFAWAT